MRSVRGVFWDFKLRLRGKTLVYFRELKRGQWLNGEKIKEIQRSLLVKLLVHAYYHVPYYNNILVENKVMNKKGNIDLDNFTKLPILDRQTLFKEYERLKSDDILKINWTRQ